jgi:hypothetical protein
MSRWASAAGAAIAQPASAAAVRATRCWRRGTAPGGAKTVVADTLRAGYAAASAAESAAARGNAAPVGAEQQRPRRRKAQTKPLAGGQAFPVLLRQAQDQRCAVRFVPRVQQQAVAQELDVLHHCGQAVRARAQVFWP